jgi:hypothetical protein
LGLATLTGLIAVLATLTGFVLLLLAGLLPAALLLLAGFIGIALVLLTRILLVWIIHDRSLVFPCKGQQATCRLVPRAVNKALSEG